MLNVNVFCTCLHAVFELSWGSTPGKLPSASHFQVSLHSVDWCIWSVAVFLVFLNILWSLPHIYRKLHTCPIIHRVQEEKGTYITSPHPTSLGSHTLRLLDLRAFGAQPPPQLSNCFQRPWLDSGHSVDWCIWSFFVTVHLAYSGKRTVLQVWIKTFDDFGYWLDEVAWMLFLRVLFGTLNSANPSTPR